MGAIGSFLSGGMQGVLSAEQTQFQQNFELQTQQAMIDNQQATQTAIGQGHAQEAAGAQAGAREVGSANSHIIA